MDRSRLQSCSAVHQLRLMARELHHYAARDAGLLHHSDQGCTSASEDYQAILDARGITCSMSRRGDCYDCEHDGAAA